MPFKEPSPLDEVLDGSSESQQETRVSQEVMGMLSKLTSTQLEGVMQVAEILGRTDVPEEMVDALQQQTPEQLKNIFKVARELKDVRKDQELTALRSYKKSFTIHGIVGSLQYAGELGKSFSFKLAIPQWQIDEAFETSTCDDLDQLLSRVARLEQSTQAPEQARDQFTKALQAVPLFGGKRYPLNIQFE